ncbi:MAG: Cof-type HAD-IIB family hydrolase [Eubacteriales bacterium]|nr:Cof-type HAD-IIB family hydrolase [Eubacteriales bacterium]
MRAVDLHVHSTKSDGTFTPSELVSLALSKNLAAFALTDHDTTDGIAEAVLAARDTDLEIIPGIELSTEYEGKDIHVVGLCLDYDTPGFQERIHAFADARELRNQKMCDRLCAAGIPVPYDELKKECGEAVVTRAHFAQYMLRHGLISSLPEAFSRYIGDDCPYFVPREKITPHMAVSFILSAHGIPILAHPLQYHLTPGELDTLVSSLKNEGLMGIEVYYCTHTLQQQGEILALADKYGLLASGGSDFHGANKPNLDMGNGYGSLFVSEHLLTQMKQRLHSLTPRTKLFFSDLDGTLLNSDKVISPATREALDQWCARGNRFIMTSGRATSSVSSVKKQLSLHYPGMFLCGFNGAEMIDCDTGRRIFREGLPIPVVRRVLDLAEECGVYCQTYAEPAIVCRRITRETEYYRRYIHADVLCDEEDPASLLPEEPGKCIAIALEDLDRLETFRLRVEEELAGQVNVFYSSAYYLEVVSCRADKGRALRRLCRYLGVSPENTIAAGDSGNDASMLEAAGLGVLMCNGLALLPELEKSADLITETDNDHDGLARILQEN